jgi:tetratricopeptide (TPR) repeat protein
MFSGAIELDPGYAAAYADRARVRTAVGLTSGDFEAARADLAKARSLAGEAPHILVREATIAALVDGDASRALQLIQRAEAIAPLSADFLMSKANFMRGAGQIEDSLTVHARALRMDPENMTILRFYVANLFAAHRVRDAMGLMDKYDKRFPGRLQHGELSRACRCLPRALCCVMKGSLPCWANYLHRPESGRSGIEVLTDRCRVQELRRLLSCGAGIVCSFATRRSPARLQSYRTSWPRASRRN